MCSEETMEFLRTSPKILSTGKSRTGHFHIVRSSFECTKAKIESRVIYASRKVTGIHINTPKTFANKHGEARTGDVITRFFTVEGGRQNSLLLRVVIRDPPISVTIPKNPVHANSNQTTPKKDLFPVISKKTMGKIRSSPITLMAIR
jgi:hypothetical protein